MVSWSLRARADLKAIHDYIAKDSPTHAKTVVRELVNRAHLNDQTPLGGGQSRSLTVRPSRRSAADAYHR